MIVDKERAPVHYLRPNDRVWTPPHVVFLDSETSTTTLGDLEVLDLRLWVAQLVDRRDVRKRSGPVYWGRGEDPGSLADQLTEWARGRRSVWVYAHNLGFDLATTALPIVLARQGWTVTDFALRSHAPWMRLSDGKSTLTLVDTWGWLASKLEAVAQSYGDTKEPLPANDGPEAEWWARCTHDVEILGRAMCDLMDWWDRNELGRWTISCAAAGWNAWRHRPSHWRVLMDPDPEQLARDRQAIRGGRRDAQVVGDLGHGQFVEVDFVAAYATIAANLPLPFRRGATFDSLATDHKAIDHEDWGVLAEVTVRTETPRYPLRYGGVTWYPVGEFKTWMAGPEIAWARECGDLVAIGSGQFHQLGWALQDWAQWVLAIMEGRTPDTPIVARDTARTWGRAVPGKFASRGSERITLGPAPTDTWGYQEGRDHDRGRPGAFVDLCGQRYWTVYDTEGENTYPAVFAWVESAVRARLGRLLEFMPSGAWIQCDTDGATLDMGKVIPELKARLKLNRIPRSPWAAAAKLCEASQEITWPLVARPKAEHGAVRLLGPQHVITDQDRKLAGVRRDAEEVSPWTFKARDWPTLHWQMGHSTPGRYTRPERTPTLKRPLVHRWITEDGECWPVVARLGADGATELVRWADSWGAHVPTPLAYPQYKGLDQLV